MSESIVQAHACTFNSVGRDQNNITNSLNVTIIGSQTQTVQVVVCNHTHCPSCDQTVADADEIQLPATYTESPMDSLILLIGDMLAHLTAHNDCIPLHPQGLTRFHSRTVPGITISDYLRRIIKYTPVTQSSLLLSLHYLDQICARCTRFVASSLTLHRFFIASISVSSKGLSDVFYTNNRYAKVGGIPLSELNILEREFLRNLDWNLMCPQGVLQEYYVNLVKVYSSRRYRIPRSISPQTLLLSYHKPPGCHTSRQVPIRHESRPTVINVKVDGSTNLRRSPATEQSAMLSPRAQFSSPAMAPNGDLSSPYHQGTWDGSPMIIDVMHHLPSDSPCPTIEECTPSPTDASIVSSGDVMDVDSPLPRDSGTPMLLDMDTS